MQCQCLKMEGIRVKLNKDKIKYLSKMQQIAYDNNIILLEMTLKNDRLYEVNESNQEIMH